MSRLVRLMTTQQQGLLKNGLKGIEKESLRLSSQGLIAQSPHPAVLGAALTHPYITTDYSEALLEFITPPFKNSKDSLDFMHNIHCFVQQALQQEYLLASSMPCGIQGDDSIPIAQYGHSNIGQMKHIYRKGLAHRYGKTMQSIAGIHFNYSVPEQLWPVLYSLEKSTQSLQDFKSSAYFDLIRNAQRQGWIMLYLFGASPAICKNFFSSRPHLMTQFDELSQGTLYHPYATSLRMSDIGYKSKNQADLNIDYNSLDAYVTSLSYAINTAYPDYSHIPCHAANYQQLNSHILQIENEYYSTIRPKQIINPYEQPSLALKRRGVAYIELRSLDLDPFNPIGIDMHTARFIEVFLLGCLLQDSPEMNTNDLQTVNNNQLKVAHEGRKKGLMLIKDQQAILLKDWANQIFDTLQSVCDILDAHETEDYYNQALTLQRQRIDNPALTPSAQILAHLSNKHQDFSPFSDHLSQQHRDYFTQQRLSREQQKQFTQWSLDSQHAQKKLEASDNSDFPAFLTHYFQQSHTQC